MTSRRPRIYLAAPLFSEAERAFNACLCAELEKTTHVFLPERDGLLYRDLIASGVSVEKARRMIFDVDVQAIRQCDVLLAVLDGRAIDEGVAFELGFAYSLSKVCIGIRTDGRTLLPTGDNPMIVSACRTVCTSTQEALAVIARHALTWGRVPEQTEDC